MGMVSEEHSYKVAIGPGMTFFHKKMTEDDLTAYFRPQGKAYDVTHTVYMVFKEKTLAILDLERLP
ncbi:hypothetical protein GcM3_094031 [Golovinomyces cichoracearum]|uniref:Uncharacterized protein n=1 Tax=Golovinomyces cichoracearum TaxID=62708 RepID=A0A420IFF2_9PEZI|nr:hypothetical protein GcM3_094031 [Golovinomyces cichoracearum]